MGKLTGDNAVVRLVSPDADRLPDFTPSTPGTTARRSESNGRGVINLERRPPRKRRRFLRNLRTGDVLETLDLTDDKWLDSQHSTSAHGIDFTDEPMDLTGDDLTGLLDLSNIGPIDLTDDGFIDLTDDEPLRGVSPPLELHPRT